MKPDNRELKIALVGIIFIGITYLLVLGMTHSVPAAGRFFGHSLGIFGFVLMLMTEVLYSVRKRSRNARWGKMSSWLQFHIFTGLVGPFMVLLHTSWQFNGLAGVVTLLTMLIVVSGFIGRYIYTAFPRTSNGFVPTSIGVGRFLIQARQDWLPVWHTVHIPIGMALFTSAFIHIIGALYFVTLAN